MRLCLLLAISTAWAGDPDAIALGRRSMKALAENRDKARRYAFREYYVNRELNANGKETDRGRSSAWRRRPSGGAGRPPNSGGTGFSA